MSATRMSRAMPTIQKVLSLGNRSCNRTAVNAMMKPPSGQSRNLYGESIGRERPFERMEEFIRNTERKCGRDLPRGIESEMSHGPEGMSRRQGLMSRDRDVMFRGREQGPEGMSQRPEGRFRRPEGRFEGPERMSQRPEGRFRGPEGRFEGPERMSQRPEGRFRGPEGRFEGPERMSQRPEGRFRGSEARFEGPERMSQRPEGRFRGPEGGSQGPGRLSRGLEGRPRLRFGEMEDVSTADTYKLVFNFRNAKPEDVKVSMKGNTLTIKGSAEEVRGTSKSSRQISAQYEIPEGINIEALESCLSEEGILTIKAPRTPPKAITIERE